MSNQPILAKVFKNLAAKFLKIIENIFQEFVCKNRQIFFEILCFLWSFFATRKETKYGEGPSAHKAGMFVCVCVRLLHHKYALSVMQMDGVYWVKGKQQVCLTNPRAWVWGLTVAA